MKRAAFGALCALGVGLGLAGCTERTINASSPPERQYRHEAVAKHTPAEKATEKPRGAGQVISDVTLTAKVKSALLADKTAPGMQINVDTKNGVVILRGEVDNREQIQKSMAIAKKTDGVKMVVNRLSVKTAANAKTKPSAWQKTGSAAKGAGNAVSDAVLKMKVKTALLADKVAPGMKVAVDTKDGVVTLSGQVDSRQQMERSIAVAKKAKGVKEVINKISVKPAGTKA